MNKSGFMFFVIGILAVLFGPCLWYHGYFAEMLLVFLLSLSLFFFLRYYKIKAEGPSDFIIPSWVAIVVGVLIYSSEHFNDPGLFYIGLWLVCLFWTLFGSAWLANPIVPKFYTPFNRASAFLIFLLTACVVFLVTYFALENSTARWWSLISGAALILQNQLWYYTDKKKLGIANREQRVTVPIVHFFPFAVFNLGLIIPDGFGEYLALFLGAGGSVFLLIFHFVQWLNSPMPISVDTVAFIQKPEEKTASAQDKENSEKKPAPRFE